MVAQEEIRPKVLLVGNGPSVLEEPLGSVIDNFDGKVVRFNEFICEPPECTGSRTDMWIISWTSKANVYDMHPELGFKPIKVPRAIQYRDKDVNFRSTGVGAMFWFLEQGYEVVLHGFDHFDPNRRLHYFEHDRGTKLAINIGHPKDRYTVAEVIADGWPVHYLRQPLEVSEPNVLFIHIPKTGGTSIGNALGFPNLWSKRHIMKAKPHKGLIRFGHQSYKHLVAAGWVGRYFDRTSYKFTFVRNPYDRAVSSYLETRRWGMSGTTEEVIFWKKWARSVGFVGFCRHFFSSKMKPLGLSTGRPDQTNIYCPQVWWLDGVSLDFIGRFESLKEDFDRLVTILGLPKTELPWDKPTRGRSQRRHYSTFYCDESRELVERAYKEDFEGLDYPWMT